MFGSRKHTDTDPLYVPEQERLRFEDTGVAAGWLWYVLCMGEYADLGPISV